MKLGFSDQEALLDWIYVGLPIAQTILTDEERLVLPELFEEAILNPARFSRKGNWLRFLHR